MSSQRPTAVIDVRDVHRRFAAITALAGVRLQVPAGVIYGLSGPDGAGKTTLLRLICGLLRPDSGSLRVLGADPQQQTHALRRQLGYMPQRFALYPDLSVAENLRFYADLCGVAGDVREVRLGELLAFSRLGPFVDRKAAQLSGGMRQKLALASALIHRPRLLLLDEPTTGVDPISRREFWDLLRRIVGEGVTILVATPYMDEAASCDRVALMASGRVLAAGAPRQLLADYPWKLIAVRTTEPLRIGRLCARVPGTLSAHTLGDRVHVATADAAAHRERLQERLASEGVPADWIHPTAPSLDDLFVSLFESRRRDPLAPPAEGRRHDA